MTWNTFNEPGESYSPDEIKDIVVLTRLSLYNQGLPCGAVIIRGELDKIGVKPLPSASYIGRILRQYGLTYRRTGHY